MEFLGVGPTEFILIIVIALIVLGPKDLAKTGKTIGKWLNEIIQSDTWKVVQKTSKELRRLPTQLMREDNLERYLTDEKHPPVSGANAGTWTGKTGTGNLPPRADPTPESKNDNKIHPPVTVDGPPAPALKPASKKSAAAPRKKASPAKKKPASPDMKPTPRKKSNA